MRARVKYNQEEEGSYSVINMLYDGQTDTTIPTGYTASRNYEVMYDEVIPNYHRRRAGGEVFFNTMYQEEITFQVIPAILHQHYVWGDDPTGYTSGKAFMPSVEDFLLDPFAAVPTNFDDHLSDYEDKRGLAITSAWANVDETELLAYATIGELPETAKWLASLYQRGIGIVKLFTSKKARLQYEFRSRKVSAKDQADAMSNMWMEMRYAVRPLLFEMEQLIKALESKGSPPRRTARGFTDSEDTSTTNVLMDLGSRYTLREFETVTQSHTYRAGVLYNIDLDDKSWASVLGVGKPLEAIWELTRLSFLFDWFFNVGKLISAWTPSASLTPLGSWITDEHTYTTTKFYTEFNRGPYPGWSNTTTSSQNGSAKVTHRLKRRFPNPEKPVYPSIDINLDWTKCLDIASIARGFLRALF